MAETKEKTPEEAKFELVHTELKALLEKHNYELHAMPIIAPNGTIMARPVLGEKKSDLVPSPIVVE